MRWASNSTRRPRQVSIALFDAIMFNLGKLWD